MGGVAKFSGGVCVQVCMCVCVSASKGGRLLPHFMVDWPAKFGRRNSFIMTAAAMSIFLLVGGGRGRPSGFCGRYVRKV